MQYLHPLTGFVCSVLRKDLPMTTYCISGRSSKTYVQGCCAEGKARKLAAIGYEISTLVQSGAPFVYGDKSWSILSNVIDNTGEHNEKGLDVQKQHQ